MRQKIIQVRLNDEEMKILKEASKKDHIPLSAWVRMISLRIAKSYFGGENDQDN